MDTPDITMQPWYTAPYKFRAPDAPEENFLKRDEEWDACAEDWEDWEDWE